MTNELRPLRGYPEELGVLLATMADTRRRTLEAIEGLTDSEVDAEVVGLPNTVGATLYHIAAIEADWLYYDLLEVDYPGWMETTFPFPVREDDGVLSAAPGYTAAQHIDRLAKVRQHFLNDIVELGRSLDERNGVQENPSTPRWILHHLSQHEAEHRGQIQVLLTATRGRT